MYVPSHFAMRDDSEMRDFIRVHPFGILVSCGDGAPVATHVPFTILGVAPLKLGAHVARANPQSQRLDGANVLAIFHGAHGFVSASWYDDPRTSVPTWDYAAVHCAGIAQKADDAETAEILERLVAEAPGGWQIEAADPGYVARMKQAIAAYTLEVTALSGAVKYSQNRSAGEIARVIEELEKTAPELAARMRAYYAARG